jgi:flagellar biosynthesis anti-sigma factor FlgM
MRIDAFNSAASQLTNEPNAAQAAAQRGASSSQAGTADRTTLTSDSTSVTSLVSQALNSPPVRQDMVDSLRLSVTSGQYDVAPAKTAAAMLDEHA